MVKPKFQLRVRIMLSMLRMPNFKKESQPEAIVLRKKINQKSLQTDKAVAWCKEHKKGTCCFANRDVSSG